MTDKTDNPCREVTPREDVLRALLRSTTTVLGGEIGRLKAEAVENEKIMANQAELLDTLTDRKRKEKEKLRKTLPVRLRIKRNDSYRASVKLALREGLWNAPAQFLAKTSPFAVSVVAGVFFIAANVVGFVIGRPIVLVAGLLGFVSENGERP